MRAERKAFDLDAYVERSTRGPCFICRMVAGDPDYRHHVVFEDDFAIAFLNKWPVLAGYTLVAPKPHRQQVTGDFTAEEYHRLQELVRRVAEAARRVTSPARSGSTSPRSAASRPMPTSTGTSRRCRRACRWRRSSSPPWT